MKNKKIPQKNYIITLVLAIGVIFLTLYLAKWYVTIREYYQNNSVMPEVVSIIEPTSLSSYLLDNPDIIMYVAASNDQDIKQFEKKFKNYIKNNNLKQYIIYMDVANFTDDEVSGIFKNYKSISLTKEKKYVAPMVFAFENGKIVDVLYAKRNKIELNSVIAFLERNNVIIND